MRCQFWFGIAGYLNLTNILRYLEIISSGQFYTQILCKYDSEPVTVLNNYKTN